MIDYLARIQSAFATAIAMLAIVASTTGAMVLISFVIAIIYIGIGFFWFYRAIKP